ncbi:hypothetical protein ACMAVI_001411 [Burkholderia cenocepacia]|uniref:hypothetical protein n=1 Tax=Burkholderia orbicola TaxID=2978683 RepID=UPI002654CAD6|nr:hypothetical protein [Burkholderia orbicola]MDN7558758.1 hypothetical protein [Burkholderia orbicola]
MTILATYRKLRPGLKIPLELKQNKTPEMKKRTLSTAGAMATAAGLTGCTAMRFEDGGYEETLDRFLVNETDRQRVGLES